MKSIVLLQLVLVVAFAAGHKVRLTKLGSSPACRGSQCLLQTVQKNDCPGTLCPSGCCPEVGWYCCPDNIYCAATAKDCPTKVQHEEAKDPCFGTLCPAGCCPNVGWVCCKDNVHCALTFADCP